MSFLLGALSALGKDALTQGVNQVKQQVSPITNVFKGLPPMQNKMIAPQPAPAAQDAPQKRPQELGGLIGGPGSPVY